MFKNFSLCSEAIGLALLVAFTFTPAVAPAAPEEIQNIVYVDNVMGDDAHPGTADEPKATIQAGADAAIAQYGDDGAVVVIGGGPPYIGVLVTNSVKFYGNAAGEHQKNLPPPLVAGGFFADGAPSVTVQGFEFVDGSGEIPVLLQNVGYAVVADNYVHGMPSHVVVIYSSDQSVSSAHVEGNRFDTWSAVGVQVRSLNDAKVTVTMLDNRISNVASGSANAVDMESQDSSEMSVTLDGNVMEEVSNGVYAFGDHDSVIELTATNNRIRSVASAGLALHSAGNSMQKVQLSDNDIQSGPNGAFYALSMGDSTFDFHAASNLLRGNESMGGAGAGVSASDTSQMTAVVEDNRIEGPFGVGSDQEGVVNFTASKNEINGVAWFTVPGLGFYGFNNGVILGALSDNRIENAGADGIVLLDNGTSTVTVAELDGNHVKGSGGSGILVDLGNAASSVNGTQNNVVHESSGNSLEVVTEPASGQIKMNGKTISPLVDTP
jgi:hypothetical protein